MLRSAITVSYYLLLLTLAGLSYFDFYLSANHLAGFFIFVAFCAVGAVLLFVSLRPPTRAHGITLAIAVAAGLAYVGLLDAPLWRAGRAAFFDATEPRLQAFADSILTVPVIRSMSDGQAWVNFLNGTHVAYTEAARDSVAPGSPQRTMLHDILQRDSIPESVYLDFRARLRSLHLTGYFVHPDRIVFARNRSGGFVYVPAGAPRPVLLQELGESEPTPLAYVAKLNALWYYGVW